MSDDKFLALAENSPQANFLFDLSLEKFSYTNPAFNTITGFNTATITLSQVLSIIPDDDLKYLRTCYHRMQKGTLLKKLEFRLHAHGQERWISLVPKLISTDYGQIFIGYVTDITDEKKNLETMKRYANDKASTLNILSHDLRGPLGIANTVTQMLEKKMVDPKLKDLVKTISKILTQTITLISDLLKCEFLESTEVELIKMRVDITSKLKQYEEQLQKSGRIGERTFTLTSSEDIIYLNLDEVKFMQVVNNLVSNALKFTRNDGVISINIEDKDQSVLFTFRDNGSAIPLEFQNSVFDKFTDARGKGLEGEDTDGLGLSIVKTIVECHQGNIWFSSKEGEGTNFFVEIPKL